MNNDLIEHIRALNIRERAEHEQRREAAIKRIKELRQRTRNQQETTASRDTAGSIS